METDNAVTLLRSLKGAPLSVLIAIRLFPGPASLLQLAAATGYERTAVTQAVTSLEMMGFVERAHYRGWQLTSAAVQLPLWTPHEIGTIAPDAWPALGAGAEVDSPQPSAGVRKLKAGKNHFQHDDREDAECPEIPKAVKNHFQQAGPEAGDERAILKAGKNHFQQDDCEDAGDPEILKAVKNHFQPPDLPAETLKAGKNHFQPGDTGSSSSSSLINLTTEVKEPLLLLPQGGLKAVKNHFQPAEPEDDLPDFDDAEQELLQDLIDLTACPRKRAEAAIRQARNDGADTHWLHLQVLYWHAYLVNGYAKNIQNPGYFVAKKLEQDEACPLSNTTPQYSDKAWDLRQRLQNIPGVMS